MTSSVKVLQKNARQCELEMIRKNKVAPECMRALEELLNDVDASLRPTESDFQRRRDLVQVFNDIAKKVHGSDTIVDIPVVEEFGSFLMGIFTSDSDLDLSVNFCNNMTELSREKKIQSLRNFTRYFRGLQKKRQVSGVQPILNAKVPVLKVVDSKTGVECDLSVENRDGILKSLFIQKISSIDDRFKKLCFLIKAWAKAQGINSSKDNTLNSLSLVLLVAFHLQTQSPPILPPFSAIFKDGNIPGNRLKEVCSFLNYGSKNKTSLAELFFTFFVKLSSVEKLWCKGLCASAFQGCWLSKTWDTGVGCISVEDFSDRSQNVARAVQPKQAERICSCIKTSMERVLAFLNGEIESPDLWKFLFEHGGGSLNRTASRKRKQNQTSGVYSAMPFDYNLSKRASSNESLVILPTVPLAGFHHQPNVAWAGMPQPVVGWGRMHQPAVGWQMPPQYIHPPLAAPIFYPPPPAPIFYPPPQLPFVVPMPYIPPGHRRHP